MSVVVCREHVVLEAAPLVIFVVFVQAHRVGSTGGVWQWVGCGVHSSVVLRGEHGVWLNLRSCNHPSQVGIDCSVALGQHGMACHGERRGELNQHSCTSAINDQQWARKQ